MYSPLAEETDSNRISMSGQEDEKKKSVILDIPAENLQLGDGKELGKGSYGKVLRYE